VRTEKKRKKEDPDAPDKPTRHAVACAKVKATITTYFCIMYIRKKFCVSIVGARQKGGGFTLDISALEG